MLRGGSGFCSLSCCVTLIMQCQKKISRFNYYHIKNSGMIYYYRKVEETKQTKN
jgi:hypothetical protein